MRLGLIGIAVAIVALLAGSYWMKISTDDATGAVISRDGLHWHATLAVSVKGQTIEIPANVGLSLDHYPIHTHDDEPGLIHMEFNGTVTAEDLKLGKFFEVWGKEFTPTNLLGNENGSGGTVRMKVNGVANEEFNEYMMRDGDVIEVGYE